MTVLIAGQMSAAAAEKPHEEAAHHGDDLGEPDAKDEERKQGQARR